MKGKKIILGVCGSIAAYKSAYLTRLLVKEGAEVQVILTTSASQFITPLTFSTLAKREALTEFVKDDRTWNNHVDLALWTDLMVIAPASANTIAKMAHGQSDNLLLATYLSLRSKVVVAPAMDLDMYKHPATQKNLNTLAEFGNIVLDAPDGELASGLVGDGRMLEPEAILAAIKKSI